MVEVEFKICEYFKEVCEYVNGSCINLDDVWQIYLDGIECGCVCCICCWIIEDNVYDFLG